MTKKVPEQKNDIVSQVSGALQQGVTAKDVQKELMRQGASKKQANDIIEAAGGKPPGGPALPEVRLPKIDKKLVLPVAGVTLAMTALIALSDITANTSVQNPPELLPLPDSVNIHSQVNQEPTKVNTPRLKVTPTHIISPDPGCGDPKVGEGWLDFQRRTGKRVCIR